MLSPKDWIQQIEISKTIKEKYSNSKEWDTYLNYFVGNNTSNDILTSNLIYYIGKVMTARTYYDNPKVIVTPAINSKSQANPQNYIFAMIVESIDNWLIKNIFLDLRKQVKLVCQDAYLYGTGILKEGYDSEYGYIPDTSNSEIDDSTLTQFDIKKKERIEYNSNIIPGMPWIQRVNPTDIFFAWNATDIHNCEWVAHRIIRNIDDVKSDIKLNKNVKDLQPTYKVKDLRLKESPKLVELYEIRDWKTGRMYIISENLKDFLYNEPDILQEKGLPYSILTFNDTGDSIWGIPDTKIIMPQQKELTEAITQAMYYRRLAVVKLIIEEKSITPEQINRLLSDDPMAVIEVRGNPQTAVKEFKVDIPTDIMGWIESIKQNARELIGFSRLDIGDIETSGRRTAYEVGQTKAGSEIRVSVRAGDVSAVLRDAINKINGFIFRNWKTERVQSVIGLDEIQYWVEYTGEDLAGDYTVSIDVEDAHPQSSIIRKQNAIELGNLFMKDPELTPPARQKLRNYILSQYGDGVSTNMIETMNSGMNIGNINQPISLKQFTESQLPYIK